VHQVDRPVVRLRTGGQAEKRLRDVLSLARHVHDAVAEAGRLPS
jgi:hypothetical protein